MDAEELYMLSDKVLSIPDIFGYPNEAKSIDINQQWEYTKYDNDSSNFTNTLIRNLLLFQ